MPDYEVTLDGKRFVLTGDHPPTEAEARAAVGSMKPVASHEQTPASESGGGIAQTVGGLLPTAGGIAGSMAGGIPGAVIGGAAGEGFKQLAQHATEIPGAIRDVARNLVTEPAATLRGAAEGAGEGLQNAALQGAAQGGAEIGGRVLGAGLRTMGRGLYQSAIKPTLSMQLQDPKIVQAAIDAGIPASRSGAAKAFDLAGQSMQKADQLVADKEALLNRIVPGAGAINPADAVTGVVPAIQEARGLPVGRPQMQAIGNTARQYMAEHPNPIPLTTAQQNVRTADRFFNQAYRASIDRSNPVTAGSTAANMGINDQTRQLLRQAVPALADQNAETAKMTGLGKAIERRVGPAIGKVVENGEDVGMGGMRGNLSPVGMQHAINAGIGSAVSGYEGNKSSGINTFLLMEALTNPAVASRLGIAAGRAGSTGLSAQAIRQALLGLMASHAVGQE